MALSTLLTEDLAIMLSTDDFGEAATIGASTVNGIFDDGLGDETDPREPRFTCSEADVPGALDHGGTVTIGGVGYWLEGWRPDGHGLVTMVLRKS